MKRMIRSIPKVKKKKFIIFFLQRGRLIGQVGSYFSLSEWKSYPSRLPGRYIDGYVDRGVDIPHKTQDPKIRHQYGGFQSASQTRQIGIVETSHFLPDSLLQHN